MITVVIIFIVILGILIFVHELGHFSAARMNDIRVYEFGFGLPPRIIGIQFISGEKTGNNSQAQPAKKWRFIWGRYDGDNEEEKKDLKEARDNHFSGSTVYSLNWIPLGGFVRIKGENRENQDADSFAVKSAWIRIKVLGAGVAMNFIFAWAVLSLVFFLGVPEAISPENNLSQGKIQISEVALKSPAEENGLQIGDEIARSQGGFEFTSVKSVQDYINANKGKEIGLKIIRGKEVVEFKAVPRMESPASEGALGVGLVQTIPVSYPWYQAIWEGLKSVYNLTVTIILGLGGMLKSLLIGEGAKIEVAGPVGIAFLTKQVASLGLIYVLQFAAILSINLGIINALPIPALDGGRILFILIEKIRKRPISQKTEQLFHTVGFVLLIGLMVLITFRDVLKFFG
jgi:regulator of sigma E protease